MNKTQALNALPENARDIAEPWMGRTDSFTVALQDQSSAFIVAQVDDTDRYDVLYVFRLGLTWAISADLQGGSADEALKAVLRRIDPMTPVR